MFLLLLHDHSPPPLSLLPLAMHLLCLAFLSHSPKQSLWPKKCESLILLFNTNNTTEKWEQLLVTVNWDACMWHLFFPSWSSQNFVQNILYGLWGISTLWLLSPEPTGHLIGNWHPNPTTLAFPIPWVFHPERIRTKETWDPRHPIKEFFKWPRSAHRSPNSLGSSHIGKFHHNLSNFFYFKISKFQTIPKFSYFFSTVVWKFTPTKTLIVHFLTIESNLTGQSPSGIPNSA